MSQDVVGVRRMQTPPLKLWTVFDFVLMMKRLVFKNNLSNENKPGFLRWTRIGSLESDKIIIYSLESEKIGSLQIHTGYLTF